MPLHGSCTNPLLPVEASVTQQPERGHRCHKLLGRLMVKAWDKGLSMGEGGGGALRRTARLRQEVSGSKRPIAAAR